MYWEISSISGVSTKAHWIRSGCFLREEHVAPSDQLVGTGGMRIVLESICEVTRKAILAGKFA